MLASLHTIFAREHNRIAKRLRRFHRNWDDERLFHEARRIFIAEYQHITYSEWLPVIIGRADGCGQPATISSWFLFCSVVVCLLIN